MSAGETAVKIRPKLHPGSPLARSCRIEVGTRERCGRAGILQSALSLGFPQALCRAGRAASGAVAPSAIAVLVWKAGRVSHHAATQGSGL